MAKKLDLSKSVYELVNQYPELAGIMDELGFHEVTKPAMLHSVGKLMTIPKGATTKKIPMTDVIAALIKHGFIPTGKMPSFVSGKKEVAPNSAPETSTTQEVNYAEERIELLKSYLKRLGNGENLEAVRADFADRFAEVEAAEIMNAEQDLMKDGTPLAEVQKLCDLHSALFHGTTKEEKIANAEIEVSKSLERQKAAISEAKDKNEKAIILEAIKGHPLAHFTAENKALEEVIAVIREKVENRTMSLEALNELRQIVVHYAKKGDLLYPHLKVKYDISGPSDVMWTVDDEIRDSLGALAKTETYDDTWYEELEKTVTRAEEMIYKEQNILFPVCAQFFTEEEWISVYRDSKDYAEVFGVKREIWAEALKAGNGVRALEQLPVDGEIVMPGGHMTIAQLTALLNTIPLEISFVDDNNINRYFNEGPKVFKRPAMAIDREVFSCHPPKIETMVRSILDSFRDGSMDSVPVWMEKNGRTMLVTYMAVRDQNKNYLGTMELVQDMEFAKEHFNNKE